MESNQSKTRSKTDGNKKITKEFEKTAENLETQEMDETQETSLRFFFQQLFDIGDLIGTIVIFGLLRLFKINPAADLSLKQSWMFTIGLLAEFVAEIIWTILIIPLIKKFTVMKDFKPSGAAIPVFKKEVIYLLVLSIMTYPMTMFMIIS